MLYIIIAICAGVSITVARLINSNLADRIGIFQGTFYNYAIGLIVSLVFLVFNREPSLLSTGTLLNVPVWAYLGGLLGVIVVAASNFVTPKISAFYLTILIFVGQIFAGIIIDYYSSDIISKGTIIGGLLVFVGLTYNMFIDKIKSSKA
ncbi:DMT family transporter [Romboutsia sp.]|uniref:DMT family transporter n=1 Tax=Romboutsia sp. TaxID=1965302 RepID=UPI002C54B0AA|nr:DMT family transporter [Romboutsia sp.]HSQ87671.1 DMT family transporter [Romboutsia sp.]